MSIWRHEIANVEELIAMIERLATETGDANARRLLETLKESPEVAASVFSQAFDTAGMDKTVSRGFLDELSLSSFLFTAVERVRISYGALVPRLSVFFPEIKDVRLAITASMDFGAKMQLCQSGPRCHVSIGLLAIVHAIFICLICRKPSSGTDTSIRARLADKTGLHAASTSLAQAYFESFRTEKGVIFAEESPFLNAMGLTAAEVNDHLRNGAVANLALASIMANEVIRFFILHEIAHYALGHAQLFRLWLDRPDKAATELQSGFPSANARRAMEMAADAWALEMTMLASQYRDSTLHARDFYAHRTTPLQRTHLVIAGVEVAFLLIGAIDTWCFGRSALMQNLRDILTGSSRDMYPGFGTRANYAVQTAIRRLSVGYPYLRWTRWWLMRKELGSMDTRQWGFDVMKAWHSAGLGGHFPVTFTAPGQADFAWTGGSRSFQEIFNESAGSKQHPIKPGSNGYMQHHNEIEDDLQVAKYWWDRSRI